MRAITFLLVATLAVNIALADEPVAEATTDSKPIRLYENFNEKLKLAWKPVRESKDHWSLTKHKGQLTIVTQRGTIHANEKADDLSGGRQARNLFLIENPVKGDRDFEITTCILGFAPTTHWQQAGLLLYNDDDNYTKLVFENSGGTNKFAVLTEIEQESTIIHLESPKTTEKIYLRLQRKDGKYIAAVSADGMIYVDVKEFEWEVKGPSRVGLIAKNGGNPDAAEIEAVFDFFEFRAK